MPSNPIFRLCQFATFETPEEQREYLKKHPIFQETADHWEISVVKKKGAYGLVITEGDAPVLTDAGNALLCAKGVINSLKRHEVKVLEEKIKELTHRVIQIKDVSVKTFNHWSEVYSQLHLHLGTTADSKYYLAFSRDSTELNSGLTKGNSNAPEIRNPNDIKFSVKNDLLTPQLALVFFPGERLLELVGRVGLIGETVLEYAGLAEKVTHIHHEIEYVEHIAEAGAGHRSHEKHPDVHSEAAGGHRLSPGTISQADSVNRASHHAPVEANKQAIAHTDLPLPAEQNIQEMEIEAIKKAVEEEKEELKKIFSAISAKEQQYHELERAWEQQTVLGVPTQILNFVNTVALEIYKEQKNMMEARRKKHEISNMQRQYDATVKQSKAPFQEPLSLPFIKRSIYQSVTPNWLARQRLEDVQNFGKEYKESQEQLAHMLSERERLVAETEGVEQKLDEYDKEIRHQYKRSSKKKSKLIRGLQNISTALHLSAGLAVGKPYGTLAAPLSSGVDICTNYLLDEESNEMNAFQNLLQSNAEKRLSLATLKNVTQQEMAHIKQSIEGGRKMLLIAVRNNAITPKEGRELLEKEGKQLDEEIKQLNQSIQKNNDAKKQVDASKATVEQRLGNYNPCGPKKHREMYERQQKDKQAVISLSTESLQLSKTNLNQTEELVQKENLQKDFEKSLEEQKRVAPIKDYLYDQLVEEVGYANSDKEVTDWQSAVNGGLNQINTIRNMRMKTVNTGFASVEKLFAEIAYLCDGKMAKAQTMVYLLSQGYNMYELFKSFRQGQQAFSYTLNSLSEGKTLVDGVIKMGPQAFLSNCIVPGIQLLTLLLATSRDIKKLASNKREEVTVEQLGHFIEALANHFNSQISLIAKGITEQHQELKKSLATILPATRELYEETIKEVHATRQILLKEIRHTTYAAETRKSYAFGEEMIRLFENSFKLMQGLEKKEKKEKAFTKLLSEMESLLKSAMSNNFSGLMPIRMPIGEDSLKVEVPLEEIKYNPEIYSRTLGFLVEKKDDVPSLYLLNCVVQCYAQLRDYGKTSAVPAEKESAEPISNKESQNGLGESISEVSEGEDVREPAKTAEKTSLDEIQMARLVSFGNDLKGFAERVLKLRDSLPDFAMQVRQEQQEVFLRWQGVIEKINESKSQIENAVIAKCLSVYDFKESIIGSSKFQIGLELTQKCFSKTSATGFEWRSVLSNSAVSSLLHGGIAKAVTSTAFLGLTKAAATSAAAKIAATSAVAGVTKVAATGAATGVAKAASALLIPGAGVPIACALLASEVVVIAGAIGINKSRANKRKKFAELMDGYSVVWLKVQFQARDVNWLIDSSKDAITEVWLSKTGELKASFYKPNSWMTNAEIGKVSKSEKYPFHAAFLMNDDPSVTVSNDSQLNITDLELIQKQFPPSLNKDLYDSQARELKFSYQNWLKTLLSKDNNFEKNPFHELAETSSLICSKSLALPPLLFPQELMKACEEVLSVERALLALNYAAPTRATYSFEYDEQEQSYKLQINFDGVINGQSVPLVTLEVAEFNKETVEAFKEASFDEFSEVDYSEFLIQMMYTQACTKPEDCVLGLSGSSTIFLTNDSRSIPVENLFPGLFKILKNAPTEKFCFNHKRFTQEASLALMEFANETKFDQRLLSFFTPRNPCLVNESIEFHHNLRKLGPSLTAEIELLAESYEKLTALFCLASSAGEVTMTDSFENWLGVLPIMSNKGVLESFAAAGVNYQGKSSMKQTLTALSESPETVQVSPAFAANRFLKEPTTDSIGFFNKLIDENPSPHVKFLKESIKLVLAH